MFLTGILCIAAHAGEDLLGLGIGVGLLVWAVGMGLGGATGFVMNQARDLGPRIAYQLLPFTLGIELFRIDSASSQVQPHLSRQNPGLSFFDDCPYSDFSKKDTKKLDPYFPRALQTMIRPTSPERPSLLLAKTYPQPDTSTQYICRQIPLIEQ